MIPVIIKFLAIYVIVLPLVIGIFRYRVINKPSKAIFWLVVVATVPQLLSAVKSFNHLNQVYNIYTFCEFTITWLAFCFVLMSKRGKQWLFASLIMYGFSIGYDFNTIINGQFSGVVVAVNNLFFLSWVMVYLFEQFFKEVPEIGKGFPFTWFLVGILFYAIGSTLYFAVGNSISLANGTHPLNPLKLIQNFFNIIMYLLFTIGFYVQKKVHV